MMGRFCSAAIILLIAGIAAAEAAPLVPSGDLPGRVPLHAVAARPLHAADPAGQAAHTLEVR